MKICRRCKKEFDGKRCNYCSREYYNSHKTEIAAYYKKYYDLRKKEYAAYYNSHKTEIAAYQKDYYKSNQEEIAAYKKDFYKMNRTELVAYHKDYQRLNPEKIKAHGILSYAVKKGEIIKQPCSICGNIKAEAHHPDYNKPLDVIWLCSSHHKRLHAELNNKD